MHDGSSASEKNMTGRDGPPQKRRWKNPVGRFAHSAPTVFNEMNYANDFCRDLQTALYQILIQSPFLGVSAIERYIQLLKEAIQRGAAVCIFVEEPEYWARRNDLLLPEAARSRLARMESMIKVLESIGAHVNLRKNIHAKLVVMDGQIFWEGSMNMLSHFNKQERLNRWSDAAKANEVLETHSLKCERCIAEGLLGSFDPQAAGGANAAESLGRSIAEARRMMGLSQSELARRLGTLQKVISMIESGHKNARLDMTIRICEELRLSLISVPAMMLPAVHKLIGRCRK